MAPKKRLDTLRRFLEELEWSTTKKYVELLRERQQLLSIGQVDVDVPQIISRRFACDSSRCIHWSEGVPLVDRSCCCRYEVPVTAEDRQNLLDHMDQIRPLLPGSHRLQDAEESPFAQSNDYGFDLVSDNAVGGCQFSLFQDGLCRCAVHQAALKHGQDPSAWKPLACSLWPLAISDYHDSGRQRFLLTIYCHETHDLFMDTDHEPFACLEDQDPAYPCLYQSERGVITYLFGPAFYRALDAAAGRILRGEQ